MSVGAAGVGLDSNPPTADRRLRLVIITQAFWPEMGAPTARMAAIVRRLAASGHEVTVATGMPNYPGGRVFPGYRRRVRMTEEFEGARIIRTAYYTTARNRSAVKQLLSYLSFVPAVFASGQSAGPLDVVLVTSPPLFPVLAAMPLAALRRARLVVDIRDLWPDEIVGVGAASADSLPVRLLSRLERRAYRRADLVTCASEHFLPVIRGRGARPERVVFQPNGADIELFRPLPADNPIAAEYPFRDRLVVTYSGLMGIKHGLEVVVEAAERLSHREDIVFFLRGDGPTRPEIEAMVRTRGLGNVIFGEERPPEDLPYLLARSDICLSTLRPSPELERIVSVKLFEYMACERPIVAALRGAGAQVVEDSGGGLVVPPGDSAALARAVEELAADPVRRREAGAAGRRFVEENYSRAASAARLERMLLELTAQDHEVGAGPG